MERGPMSFLPPCDLSPSVDARHSSTRGTGAPSARCAGGRFPTPSPYLLGRVPWPLPPGRCHHIHVRPPQPTES